MGNLKTEMSVKLGRPLTNAEMVRRSKIKARDIGEIPDARHRRVKERCRRDLVMFGRCYCGGFLQHPPSDAMIHDLILPLQNVILDGGQEVIQFPRSTGKTTWTKIAVMWAILYGHKRFVMTVAATGELADVMQNEIINAFADEDMEMLAVDFPGVSKPLRACEANPKKAKSVVVNGESAGIYWKGHRFIFPSVKDRDGKVMEPSAGAVLVSGSVGGSIKGAVKKKERPDFVILDDPQNLKMAESPTLTLKAEAFIDGDVMGLRGQTEVFSAVMAITPIRIGDLASRYTNKRLHPEWYVASAPYLRGWTEPMQQALDGFKAAYYADLNTGDFKWDLSRKFYLDHREVFHGASVIDPMNFTRDEVDAIHHVLIMKTTVPRFEAEYQMNVAEETNETALLPEDVLANLSGYERCVIPEGAFECVAFCDVNTQKGAGLRWGVLACGGKITSVIAYGQYPEDGGSLVPPGSDPSTRDALIVAAIKTVTAKIINLPIRSTGGARVYPKALCFDGGFAMDAVNNSVQWIAHNVKLHGMQVMWSLGRSWAYFGSTKRNEARNVVKNHVYSGVTIDRRKIRAASGDVRAVDVAKKYLVIHTDFWRETMQKSFFKKFPAPYSCAVYGKTMSEHRKFADELTYERLIRTYRDEKTRKPAWEWDNTYKGHNHYADVVVGCFALAAWMDLYIPRMRADSIALNNSLRSSPSAVTPAVPRTVTNANRPLFRKIQRPRIVR